MFFTEKDGYKKSEVNAKIESMANEIEYLKFALEEKDKLNISLATALEKTRHIQESTKSLYDLKLQKVLILYKAFRKVLTLFLCFTHKLKSLKNLKSLFLNFQKHLRVVLMIPTQKIFNNLLLQKLT
ncbi:MAG: hypothetical protein IKV69_01585, partial [Clostridia bacterium]|nr:hypothetical protein [Clostridia bacterium]